MTRSPNKPTPQSWLIVVALLVLLSLVGCKERYRVGDYVLVEWCNGEYPAYVISRKGRTRYRVHLDGYETRWDTDVGFEQIKRRLDAPPDLAPPLCEHVARALGKKPESDNSAASLYEVGARVSVRWRGGVYKATIVEVIDRDRMKVHYEGHEAFWDEVITAERVVNRLP